MMEGKSYSFGEASLHYIFYKGGPDIVLCFHGYGQSAQVFEPLAERLRDRYSIYSFDLFFHGESSWPDCEDAISTDHLCEIINSFLDDYAIKRVSLCGYSLGGKIVLSLAERLGPVIRKIMLIAPDGINTNIWYSLATYPYWMRRLFKYSIRKPAPFFFLLSRLSYFKILDRSVAKFAERQMNTIAKRKKVYCTWLAYRKIHPDITVVANQFNQYGIPVLFILGAYDIIITRDSIKHLTKKVGRYHIQVLNRGHNSLIEDTAAEPELDF